MGQGMDYVADLDAPLLQLSPADRFTLRDACQGVHVFGGIGSGKTSGSGAALASAYLRAGFGGLVLCAKPDEVERWLGYARANGRSNSVVVLGDSSRAAFNFISYEFARQGLDGVGSVVECLLRILEAARLSSPTAGRSGEAFWENATRQLLSNVIPLLFAAEGTVDVPGIVAFIASAPKDAAQLHDASWQHSSFMFRTMLKARREPRHALPEADQDKIASYWRDEFAALDPKTRSNIAISASTILDRFNRGRLQRVFCGETNIVPELSFHGAIILMNMPALTWNEDGIIGQQLFKYMWQRAVLARNGLAPSQRDRPVFLWADEAQYFVNSFDTDFQSTCRSSKACTVYLTQSLPTYYARMGGEQPKAKADMLLANFLTKVFHNNADPETNRWAADTIGRTLVRRANFNEGESFGRSSGMNAGESENWGTSQGSGGSAGANGQQSASWNTGSNRGGGDSWGRNRGTHSGGSVSSGYSEAMDYEVEPAAFSRVLRTGGPANGARVTGLWFQAGKTFRDSERNYLHVTFRQ
jgi:hypothetical protein